MKNKWKKMNEKLRKRKKIDEFETKNQKKN